MPITNLQEPQDVDGELREDSTGSDQTLIDQLEEKEENPKKAEE